MLVLDAETEGDVEKAQVSERGKYLETTFLLRSDRHWYNDMIMLIKNDYAKQHKKYPKTLTDMYRLMVAFDPTRPTPVSGGRK